MLNLFVRCEKIKKTSGEPGIADFKIGMKLDEALRSAYSLGCGPLGEIGTLCEKFGFTMDFPELSLKNANILRMYLIFLNQRLETVSLIIQCPEDKNCDEFERLFVDFLTQKHGPPKETKRSKQGYLGYIWRGNNFHMYVHQGMLEDKRIVHVLIAKL